MQRQSLGSPVSKNHSHGAPKDSEPHSLDDPKSKDSASSSSLLTDFDDHRLKSTRPRRLSSSLPQLSTPQKLIHLIPVLTLLCFLILYLSSHNPSQSDADAAAKIGDVGRGVELSRDDVLAIRSLRSLREIDKHAPKLSRSHRKIADF
ncbi:uncharacterized protein LOC110811412 isoform X2 [Carica papaya]|uniref:uncharacterized protein LOC110811412 isoform X2 n=1 Tax=Carica papaya TaxID=3649 RepID=UPI000B8CD6C8|nr:uncharacterized protein LOC110811412 isoform X2 [Carica papaya]